MADVNSPAFWDWNYNSGVLPWDLDGPTPVFERLAKAGQFTPGRMLVLGAGRGHDARLFARHGFEVTAVDFSPYAIEAMQQLADPRAPIALLQADIFQLPNELNGRFDLILEYTLFCAIDPRRRVDYADVVARLLKPGGQFVALAFPIITRTGGPPFAVFPNQIIALLSERGFELRQREMPPDSAPGRHGKEELLILQKVGVENGRSANRTHDLIPLTAVNLLGDSQGGGG